MIHRSSASTAGDASHRRWWLSAAAVALLAASVLVTTARAADPQGTAPRASTTSTLADTTKPATFLKEVVVTGARYPRAYYESPQALSFISRQQLRQQAPTVLGDVLGTLPGVDQSKDSPWEQRPVLRGLSGQRVLVLMDGSPVNSARGNGPHPSLVDPAQVERIEIVRGPSSVAYGSDALGGVINIITREAQFTAPNQNFRGSATLGGSSADMQRNGYLELMPRLGRLSAFLSGGFRKTDDFHAPHEQVANSSFSDYNALANLRYQITEHMALKGGYQQYRGTDIGIPGLTGPVPGGTMSFSFPFYNRDAAHLTLSHAYPHGWLDEASAKVYWQREHRNFFSNEDVSLVPPPPGPPPPPGAARRLTLQDRYFDVGTYGFQTQFTSLRLKHFRISAGADLARDHTDGDNVRHRTYYDAGNSAMGPAAVRVTASIPDGRFDNYAGFTQTEWYLHPQWTLSAGGRYTHYHYRTEAGVNVSGFPFTAQSADNDALSGSLGLVYSPMKDLHLTANVANGYRQPNAQDLFFSGPASVGFVIGNPGLKPEKSGSYDVGLRWGPGDFAMAGNLFYSTYNNLIDAIAVASPPQAAGQPTYEYVNISEARIWGAEAEAEWRFRPQWTARTTVAGTVGDITNRDAIQQLYAVDAAQAPLPNVPPFKGSAALRWTNGSGRLWVEGATRYSWRTNRLPLPTPGVGQLTNFKKEWIVGDLFAGVRLGNAQRLVLGVRNITNRPYRQALASLEDPGISFVGSLSTDF